MSESVTVVAGAGAYESARGVSEAAGGVYGRPEYDRTGHVTEHADRELYHTHRHRLV